MADRGEAGPISEAARAKISAGFDAQIRTWATSVNQDDVLMHYLATPEMVRELRSWVLAALATALVDIADRIEAEWYASPRPSLYVRRSADPPEPEHHSPEPSHQDRGDDPGEHP